MGENLSNSETLKYSPTNAGGLLTEPLRELAASPTQAVCTFLVPNYRAGEPYRGRVSKLSTNFEEILLRGHGNFEEQSKYSESS
jgi:hypothetical protein